MKYKNDKQQFYVYFMLFKLSVTNATWITQKLVKLVLRLVNFFIPHTHSGTTNGPLFSQAHPFALQVSFVQAPRSFCLSNYSVI